ncbi:S-layer protein [Candidatus Woesearchaeota archaeon]|nr:S-layer protein [Candidatus Woesearchaeota archaeon]
MSKQYAGWDVGGAHLKVAALNEDGLLWIGQEPCPLWQGLDRLESALAALTERMSLKPGCQHIITMTGELADCFLTRQAGVETLANLMQRHLSPDPVRFFDGSEDFLNTAQATIHWKRLASANWMATARWACRFLQNALLVDIGSTTTDIITLRDGAIRVRGYSDEARMRYDELLYTGVVRTPLMALTRHIPHAGEWTTIMAEHFATTADVYRLTGELTGTVDQSPAADGGEKTLSGSARRLARMLGTEAESFPLDYWQMNARFWRERQLEPIRAALERHLSGGGWPADAPLVGVGIGRFLVQECATRLQRPYRDINAIFPPCISTPAFSAADCTPAAALVCLASSRITGFPDDDPN